MKVQARFKLNEDTRIQCHTQQGGNWVLVSGARVRLSPVSGEPFGSATPNGNMEMVLVNQDAVDIFRKAEIGQEFDVIISPVEKKDQ